MSGWGGGYITDIAYNAGYYPQQSPWHLALCATVAGFRADFPDDAAPFSYLELGCGLGLGAIMLAAANPGWRVTAIDFNPAHIAQARLHAAAAGLSNISFMEADLATLPEDPAFATVPDADMVSLHGVWSWVAPAVQNGIVRLLKARVRPGGLVHVTYNALPGWQGALGLQRLVRAAGSRQLQRSDRQAEMGLAFAQSLMEADAIQLSKSPIAASVLEKFGTMSNQYLAHELMNAAWVPCFHAELAEAMEGARLDWVASANIRENFPDLMLTAPQRVLLERYDDPIMWELIKDTCLTRGLRSDIFIRGAVRLSEAGRHEALGGLSLGLVVPPSAFSYDMELPVGTVAMNQPFYGSVVSALADGPMRLDALAAHPGLAGHACNPVEVASLLIGSEQAHFVARPGADIGPAAIRANAMVVRAYVDTANLGAKLAVASARLGSGLRCPAIEAFVIGCIVQDGKSGPDQWAAALGPNLPDDQGIRLRAIMATLADERGTAWRLAGFL